MQVIKNRSRSQGTFSRLILQGFVATSLSFSLLGCGGGPAGYAPASFDPASAAEQALSAYDANKDGFVDAQELEKAPGLRSAIKTFDKNNDGKVSGEEIAERVNFWNEMEMGITNITCEVLIDGQPMEGAVITFDPEEFQGNAVQPAECTTSVMGMCSPIVPKDKRPSEKSPAGIQPGLYKVRVSKMVNGKETVPSSYNSETTLGQQVSQDDPAILQQKVIFHIKTK